MTDLTERPTSPDIVEPELLFPEAKQHARRRHLWVAGLMLIAATLIAALAFTLFSGGTDHGAPGRGGRGSGGGGTAAGPTPASVKTYPLPSDGWTPGHPSMLALIDGPLRVTVTSSGACAWIGTSLVLFPAGYRVRLNPTEVLDPSGKVIATQGETISSGGGTRPTNMAPPISPSCLTNGRQPFQLQSSVQKVVERPTTAPPS